jgi:hypothetical protein
LLRAETAAFAAAVRAGRAAARAMWTRSRDPRARGPNERMLDRDAERLREWRHWLKQAARNPAIVGRATPVCGAWQLQFTVHHFAPAMQKIIVEQRQPDGSWTLLHESHLIEFRAFAARPRTRIRREFSVPVAEPLPAPTAADGRRLNAPLRSRATAEPGHLILQSGTGSRALTNRFPCLRLAVRGLGQVGVSNVELTNGVLTFRPPGWPTTRQKILGRPAPRQDFPANLAASPVGVPLAFPAQSAPSSDRASRRNADRRQLPAD